VLDAVTREVERLPVAGHETEWGAVRMEQGIHARERGDLAAAERLLIAAEGFAEKSPARELELPDIYPTARRSILNKAGQHAR
jgi:hypothetical protein